MSSGASRASPSRVYLDQELPEPPRVACLTEAENANSPVKEINSDINQPSALDPVMHHIDPERREEYASTSRRILGLETITRGTDSSHGNKRPFVLTFPLKLKRIGTRPMETLKIKIENPTRSPSFHSFQRSFSASGGNNGSKPASFFSTSSPCPTCSTVEDQVWQAVTFSNSFLYQQQHFLKSNSPAFRKPASQQAIRPTMPAAVASLNFCLRQGKTFASSS